ncbi:DNA helicase [Pseudohoeflea suaedae]|uniref:DNA helicase n=1 Tax=Pseudohoeflea suaedae TaxID=877384 RepID=A0A4R5PJD4_9HYPH|nr:DEAD/DEAH box helicase family protein [Pseudohoeflea suaedae]TDH35696.1 DNA helicase [Pseudohoeflea suaedae]
MKFSPRYYQIEAVDAIFDYWSSTAGHPLVDMAGGSGKSGTMAMLIKRLYDGWPDMRILSCVHVEELVGGNFEEFVGMAPFAPAGIYAASIGKRQSHAQILFAQLQTVWNKAQEIGHVDVMIVDEVHLVPNDNNTMYRKLIDALMAINPDMKIVGFTATPYRLDSGRLDEGEDRLFDAVVYAYSVEQGIDDGYLCRLTSKPCDFTYDTGGVRRLGGDFKKSDLAVATDKDELTRAAVAEIMRYTDLEDRKTAVIFCNGIAHAEHVRDEIRAHGKTCEVLSGKTPKGERRQIISDLKSGKLWGCTNDNVLSTGTNIPCIDLVADLAPTESTNRYVQRAVRGTRVVWPVGFNPDSTDAAGRKAAIASSTKPNCRYMNFAGNIERHGPIDCVTPRAPGKGTGEAPIKVCPQDAGGCGEMVHASARVCPNCFREFELLETPKFSAKPTDVAILQSTAEPETRRVTKRVFRYHEGKAGKPDSVKVAYMTGLTQINEWVCPAHSGFAKQKADQYWFRHRGKDPAPSSPLEWIKRQAELADTEEIKVRPDGRYWQVLSQTVAAVSVEDWGAEVDDGIPF